MCKCAKSVHIANGIQVVLGLLWQILKDFVYTWCTLYEEGHIEVTR